MRTLNYGNGGRTVLVRYVHKGQQPPTMAKEVGIFLHEPSAKLQTWSHISTYIDSEVEMNIQ